MGGFSLSGIFGVLKDKFMIVFIVVLLVTGGVIAAFTIPAINSAIDKGKASSGSMELREFEQYNGGLKTGSDVVAAMLQYANDPLVGVAIVNGAVTRYAENKIGAAVAYAIPATSTTAVGAGAAITAANQLTYQEATNRSASTYVNPAWNYTSALYFDTAGAPALIVFTRQ